VAIRAKRLEVAGIVVGIVAINVIHIKLTFVLRHKSALLAFVSTMSEIGPLFQSEALALAGIVAALSA